MKMPASSAIWADSRIAQMTFADAAIKILLQLCALLRSSSIFSKCSHSPRRDSGMESARRNVTNLNETGKIAMRQITAFVPARESPRPSLRSVSGRNAVFFPSTSRRRYSRLVRGGTGISKQILKPLSRKPIHWSSADSPTRLVELPIIAGWSSALRPHACATNCRNTKGKMPPCW